jgi:regulator of protease activity HflC (stomatin/prohibitin superfamily)
MKSRIVITVIALVSLIVSAIGFNSCTTAMYYIPAGYVGRIMTPSGWDEKILEPGQINLGVAGANGQFSTLVLLEATTITVEEQFRSADFSSDKQDHRILTKDGVPTTVDMYVRLMLPDDEAVRNNIFVQVTPEKYGDDPREKVITLNNVYKRFTELDIRNKVRTIISAQANFQSVLANYSNMNDQITAAALKAFADNHVPLKLQDAQLSQIMPDPQVWDSEVKSKASEALKTQIEAIGQATANNPGYLEYLKWQTLNTAFANGNNTIVITDGNNNNGNQGLGLVIDPSKLKPLSTPAPTSTPNAITGTIK